MAFEINTPGAPVPVTPAGTDLIRAAEAARQARIGAILARAGNPGDRRYTSDRALHLTDGGAVVEDGDPAGRFLLVGAGGSIPQDLADELHIGPRAKAANAEESPAPAEGQPQAVADLPLSDAQKAAILAAGYDSRERLAAASDEDLHAIPGIGDASVAKIRDLYPAA